MKHTLLVSVAVLAIAATAPAKADPTLPSSSDTVAIQSFYFENNYSPAQSVEMEDDPSYSFAYGDRSAAVNTYGPNVSASVAASVGFAYGAANPFAYLAYFFEVFGPPTASIDMRASGSLANYVTPGVQNWSESSVDIYQVAGEEQIATVAECVGAISCTGYNNAPAPDSEIFLGSQANYSIDFTVQSNTVYEVLLGAAVSIEGTLLYPQVDGATVSNYGDGYAYADPYLTIAPTFLSQNPNYSLLLSPEITQVDAVPEPASLALLSTSLFGLGLIRRRHA